MVVVTRRDVSPNLNNGNDDDNDSGIDFRSSEPDLDGIRAQLEEELRAQLDVEVKVKYIGTLGM